VGWASWHWIPALHEGSCITTDIVNNICPSYLQKAGYAEPTQNQHHLSGAQSIASSMGPELELFSIHSNPEGAQEDNGSTAYGEPLALRLDSGDHGRGIGCEDYHSLPAGALCSMG